MIECCCDYCKDLVLCVDDLKQYYKCSMDLCQNCRLQYDREYWCGRCYLQESIKEEGVY